MGSGVICLAGDLLYAFRCADGFERPVKDWPGAGKLMVIVQPMLQQLGVRKDHPELIVELMKQLLKVRLWQPKRLGASTRQSMARRRPVQVLARECPRRF